MSLIQFLAYDSAKQADTRYYNGNYPTYNYSQSGHDVVANSEQVCYKNKMRKEVARAEKLWHDAYTNGENRDG